MTLHQGQPAGLREQVDQHHWLVIYREIVGTYQPSKGLMADIGPGRLEREIIINLTWHAPSGTRRFGFAGDIPTEPPKRRKIDPCGKAAALRSRVDDVAGQD